MGKSTGKPRRKLWQRIGLVTFFALFMASGALRIGTLDIAFASAGDPERETAANSSDPGQCAAIEPLELALSRVEGRAERLDAREAAIDARAQAVAEAEAMVTGQLAALEETEARLEALLSLSDTAAESDLERLTEMYETMDAGDAAALFTQMDPSFAAGFLGRMQSDAAAGVLAELDPAVAYSISVLLATRNATPPATQP
ncbi:MotE family protein [Alterinioella nitratireducens]|uniref:MotE family protein n=1 Tax=Alterinioella nitratireducens TaxID=2735915 RepID=UPI00405A1F0E